MGKARRNQRPKKAKEDNLVYDESLSKADIPSTKELSSEYYNDEIDDYHEKKFKSLMEKGVKFDSDEEQYDSEEEVMALDIPEEEDDDDDDDDDDEEEDEDDQLSMGSDLEDRDRDGLPDAKAWGQKKKIYYDTDYKEHSKKKGKKTKEELEAEAEEEEEEAQNIQKRLANTLSEEDYGLDFLEEFSEQQTEGELTEGKIVKDLEKMSDKEKRKLLKKESPELLELLQDLKLKLAEVKNELEPLLKMVKNGTIPKGKGSDYVQTKFQLYMNYCTNISYYLFLKAKRLPITGHPVIERLVTYRNLINELAPLDEQLSPQVSLLLSEDFQKNPDAFKHRNGQPKSSKKAAVKRPLEPSKDSDLDEDDALNYYKMMEDKLQEKRKRREEEAVDVEPTEEEMDPNAKRAITYQIAKNKGLTPKRKKIDRNPRVKHREKFRRAKIRRKGQVREVRKEEARYSGEISGIRAGVKKSIKLK